MTGSAVKVVLRTERLQLRCFDVNDAGWLQHIGDRGVRSADDARRWNAFLPRHRG
jgi:hypothetical protein